MKHLLNIVIFVCSMNCVLNAQAPVLERTAKALKETSAVRTGLVSHYGGNLGALSGVDFHLTQTISSRAAAAAAASSLPSTARAGISSAPRSWFTQQTRDIKALRIKQQRRKQHLAATKSQQEELPELLIEQSFTVNDFANFVPIPHQTKPAVPFTSEPKKIAYRGLALSTDGDAIRNIIKNGLRLQDAGEENSTLRQAYASHGGWYAMRYVIENPVTNVTYGPQSAASWGARRISTDKPILTLIKIRGEFLGDSMETVTSDIPAEQIEEIVTRLNINGNLTWCKVQLNEDGSFSLTPYEPHYGPRK